MAWATPVLHAVGDVLSASDWNIGSDDLTYLYDNSNVAARVFQTLDNALPGTTDVQMTELTADYLYGGMTFASNAVTVPNTDIYTVACNVTWDDSVFGSAELSTVQVQVNGSSIFQWNNTADVPFQTIGGSGDHHLNAGDVVTFWANSGSNANTGSGSQYTWMSITKVAGP